MVENITGENVTNVTLNPEILGKATDIATSTKETLPLVFQRVWDLASAPFHHQEMLWILFPLFFTLIVLEFYFDRHGDEELGWGAAIANSLILVFIGIDLLKHSFHYATPWVVLKEIVLATFTDAILPLEPQVLILILFLGALGMAVTLINYYHLLPRKMAFIISSHPPINFLAYFAIVIVYSTGTEHEIPFDLATLIAGAVLFIILLLIVFVFKRSINQLFNGDNQRRW